MEELTPRQREVLELLRLGLTNGQISQRLDVSTRAVKYHVSEILSKLQVRNRFEAATWPERPPWWIGAFAPLGLLLRRAGAALPMNAGAAAMAVSGSLLFAALAGFAIIAGLLFAGRGNGPAPNAEAPAQTATSLVLRATPQPPSLVTPVDRPGPAAGEPSGATPEPAGSRVSATAPQFRGPAAPGVTPQGTSELPTPGPTDTFPPYITAVSTGGRHTCALTAAGRAVCWGAGFGTTPIEVLNEDGSPLDGVTAIAAGGYHTCALTESGGVKCWGDNYWGQLGDGPLCTPTDMGTALGVWEFCSDAPAPVDVTGLSSGVVAISAGADSSCAETTANQIKCWGRASDLGQQEKWTQTCPSIFSLPQHCSTVPVDMEGLSLLPSQPTLDHQCEVTAAGGVQCWGNNEYGQVADWGICGRICTSPVNVRFDPPPPMSLTVTGAGTTCDNPTTPTSCAVPLGATFTLSVSVIDAPRDGYIAFNSYIRYGKNVTYVPVDSADANNVIDRADAEIVWPDATGGFQLGGPVAGVNDAVQHAASTAVIPPFPVSSFKGVVVSLSMTCSADGTSAVDLVPRDDARAGPDGALFVLPDNSQVVVKQYSLIINCANNAPPPATEAPATVRHSRNATVTGGEGVRAPRRRPCNG